MSQGSEETGDAPARLSADRRAHALLGVALGCYLLLPGHQLSWLPGLPLGPLSLGLLVGAMLFLYAAWPDGDSRKSQPATRTGRVFGSRQLATLTMLTLCGAKLVPLLLSPSYGLEGSYHTRVGPNVQPERSTEFPQLQVTRVDSRLDFEAASFPIFFFNDNVRFNYYRADEPDRATLPFWAEWRGRLRVPRSGAYAFWLGAEGAARLEIGQQVRLEVDGARAAETQATLEAGIHNVHLSYARRRGDSGWLSAQWDGGGRMAPLAAPALTTEQARFDLPWIEEGAHVGALLLDAGYMLLFLLAVARALLSSDSAARRERLLLAGLLAIVLLYAIWSSAPLYRKMVVLEGGADWLTYETYARDIQLNGPLMTLGRPIGRARPYFFQPFYPYALAGYHTLSGEDLFGVVVLQLVGIGVTTVLVYHLARKLFGRLPAAIALLLLLAVLGPLQLDWVARHLLSENVYFFLLPATALAFIRYGERGRLWMAILAGALLGLCAITRGPTLLWVPCCYALAWIMRRRVGGAAVSPIVCLAVSLLVCLAVVALVPLRNLIASGQPVLTATNGMATMELAHPVPAHIDLEGVERNPIYRGLRLDFSVVQMIEYVRQDPVGYANTLWPLGLYALGLPAWLEEDSPIRWELLSLVGLYGLYLARRAPAFLRRREQLDPRCWLLHSFIGLHFAMMMVFLPNVYGYRQVLPMYLFIVVFASRELASLAVRYGTAARRGGSA